jgi:ribosomal protein L11 methyltransferase
MPDPEWLEVSLVVDGEYAEAVAEVLARFTPGGVAIESTEISPDPVGEGEVTGPLRVRGFLPVNESLEETRHKLEEALWYLGRIRPDQPRPIPQFSFLGQVDWVEAWKQSYRPIPIGHKLMIVPAWLEPEVGDRVAVRIDPGMAFGTGTHPTTQLCLELVEKYPADIVIDVGCGSAILSIAALKLGTKRALGVDVDPQAVSNALFNAAMNGVTDRLEVGLGSVKEILSGNFTVHQAPLVLANILSPVLAKLLGEGMADLLSPGGVLVISGILAEQWDGPAGAGPDLPALKEVVQAHGLEVLDLRRSGDWVAAALTKVP